MKLKGLTKLNKVINNFTEKFGVTAIVNLNGTDFYAEPAENLIAYPIDLVDEEGQLFMENILSQYGDGVFNNATFLASLLHEVGHCMTEYLIEDNEAYLIDERERLDRLAMINKNNPLKKAEIFSQYCNLEDEKMATEWAVDYYNTHKEECDNFLVMVCRAFDEFYSKNKKKKR